MAVDMRFNSTLHANLDTANPRSGHALRWPPSANGAALRLPRQGPCTVSWQHFITGVIHGALNSLYNLVFQVISII